MILNMIVIKYCWFVCLQLDCMYFWIYIENVLIRQDVDIGKLGFMWFFMLLKDEFGYKYIEVGQLFLYVKFRMID